MNQRRRMSTVVNGSCRLVCFCGYRRVKYLLVGLCFGVVSVIANPPCFANDVLDPVTRASLGTHIAKLVSETDGLLIKARDLKQEIGFEFLLDDEHPCIDTPHELLNGQRLAFRAIDDRSCPLVFMHLPTTSDIEQIEVELKMICDRSIERTASVLWIMRKTYDILNELANYFEHLQYSRKTPTVRASLMTFQEDIYRSMCVLNIALKSQYFPVDSSEAMSTGRLSAFFLQNYKVSTRSKYQAITYWTVRDSVYITDYINYIFHNIQDCIMNTCI